MTTSDSHPPALHSHPLMMRLLDGADPANLAREAVAAMLGCTTDSPPPVWRRHLDQSRSVAVEQDRPDVVEALDRIKRAHQEWFGTRV